MARSFQFGGFEVDEATGRLLKNGTRVHLREQSFQVLLMLLEHPGGVVSREELRRRLWPVEVFIDFENSVNVAIARLREALNDSADRPRYVETLPRRGYRFLVPVTVRSTTAEPAQASRPKARLLVLPFVNSSGDADQEYFSDAMTDEIIAELSNVAPAELAVIARTTSMYYKGRGTTIPEIGRELSVAYVVEGSARRVDDRAQLTVQLVRADDHVHVLARRYDIPLSDLFATQREVARAVGEQLHLLPAAGTEAGPGAAARPRRPPTDDIVAYNSYIQGRYHLDRPSPANWAKAHQYFQAAIARDPKCAPAYASLAELFWDQGLLGFMRPKVTLPAGLSHALRAVEIDGTLAEPHALLGQFLKQIDFNWTESQREMALALALNPSSPVVRMRHGISLMPFGCLDQALADLHQAIELDPRAVMPRIWRGIMLWLDRQHDRAIEQGRIVVELQPEGFTSHFLVGLCCGGADLHDEAIAAHRRSVELSGGSPMMLGWLGLALARSGDAAGARAVYERLRSVPAETYVPPTSLAWIHIGLGEVDGFFDWMERAIDERDHMITPIKSYPFLDPIRDDARYLGLLQKMNLS